MARAGMATPAADLDSEAATPDVICLPGVPIARCDTPGERLLEHSDEAGKQGEAQGGEGKPIVLLAAMSKGSCQPETTLPADLVLDGESQDGEEEHPVLIGDNSDAEESGSEAAPARSVTLHPETSERSLCV